MTTLQAPLAGECSDPAECEVGDWLPSSRIPAWNKKVPVQEYRPSGLDGIGEPRVFIRDFGRADGLMQTLWKRVE